MSIRRWNPAADSNQLAVMQALRDAGALVWRLNEPSLPDLLVGFHGRWVLLEVKKPLGAKGGAKGSVLTPSQEKFFKVAMQGRLPAYIVRTAEAAMVAIGLVVSQEEGEENA